MSLRRLWLISITNRTVIYMKSFPIAEVKAKQLGFSFLPALRGAKEEAQFVHSLFAVLGIESSLTARASSQGEGQEEGGEGNDSSDACPPFDCTLSNQLPVVEMTFKGVKLWPVMIIEQNSVLFCALPLINSDSNQLIDHISVSLTFAALQALIKQFSRENRVSSLEDFICSVMPFGSFVGETFGCLVTRPSSGPQTAGGRRQEDSLVAIKISESISSGKKGKETIYGTVTVESNQNMSEKAALVLKVNQLDLLNAVLSPQCSRTEGEKIRVKLNERFLKYFHYKCDPSAVERVCPFLSYEYKVTRYQQQKRVYKLELTIQVKSAVSVQSVKFAFFNVQFKQGFVDGAARVANSNLNWGQLHIEKPAGLFWIIGSKFPKTGKIALTCDVHCTDDRTDFSEAICNFRADKFTLGLRISSDCIIINEHVLPNSKLLIESSVTSFDYKLHANYE